MKLRAIVSSWVVLGGVLGAFDALACTCERPPMNPNPLEAPHIFVGQVATIEDYATSPSPGPVKLRKVCLVPEYVVWGLAPGSDQRLCVVTGLGDGDCGIPFELGESYLVYAGSSADDAPGASLPYTGLCWGTSKVRRVRATVPSPWLLPAAGFLAGLGMGAAFLLVLRRLRRPAVPPS